MHQMNDATQRRPLTRRQQQIYQFVVDFIANNNAPPTRIEIAQHFGFKSPNAAEDHLKALAKKGYIDLKSGTSRGITLLHTDELGVDASNISSLNTTKQQQAHNLAIIGDVAAGEPILAQQHIQEHINIEPHAFNDHADFLLRVKGDSMQDIGINEHDLLAIKNTHTAQNKQIVVARIGDEVTVKRFFQQGNRVSLVAENSAYKPIEIDLSSEEFVIEGVVVGLIRQHF